MMKLDEESVKRSAGRLINELSKASHIYFSNEFKKYSIGHAQIRTLLFIAHHPGLTQKELARRLNLDKSSITSQLNILEGNGYIRRQTSKIDARIQHITLTNKTKEILEPLRLVFSLWTETLLYGFTEREKDQLFNYLERMIHNVEISEGEIK